MEVVFVDYKAESVLFDDIPTGSCFKLEDSYHMKIRITENNKCNAVAIEDGLPHQIGALQRVIPVKCKLQVVRFLS